MVVLFLWFGINQLLDPSIWITYLPEWTGYLPIPGEMLVMLNGWTEIILAAALALGTFVRPVSIILALHLFGIAIVAGGAIGMRDATLGMSLLALALGNTDSWTMDAQKSHKRR